MKNVLRLPALRVEQTPGKYLYSFAVNGKLVPTFATVSRIRRPANGRLVGYQRPEIISHINEIKNYLESDGPMVPNAVVIAFDSRVRFETTKGPASDRVDTGSIVIPIEFGIEDQSKPGFIVDGQQRLAAIREAAVDVFPLFVTAFISDDISQQTEQFILVNTTKPLPKGLIYELLPITQTQLPALLHRRRFPAELLSRLNADSDSPFQGAIHTPTNPQGLIKDNSILRMIENSLSDGVLYRFRDEFGSGGDADRMLRVLKDFWWAARNVFRAAWGLPPKKSRLMHGAGVVSLGLVMDAISDRLRESRLPAEDDFREDLTTISPVCRWTDGYWDFGVGRTRKWNEIQNTSKDIAVLSNYLLTQYRIRVWATAATQNGSPRRSRTKVKARR